MTSAINPNNIDGTYPVAGQDNDSQGFRDNFTNTKQNFSFAAAEITDLQNKAVLKSALTGTTLNNDMGGSILSNAQLQDISETVVSSLPSTGTVTINYAAGGYQKIPNTTGSVSLTFTNFPPSGQLGRVRVQVIVTSISHKLILPVAVSVGTSNLQGYANNEITFNQTGTYEFEFETSDGGATISIFDLNRNRDPLYLPSLETFAANGNVSLTRTTTVVTSSSNLTGNLLAGAEGQVKILAYGNTSAGNALITVTNAAWGGANLANLSAVGSAATFQYINGKWFCVGNNGVTFS